MRRRAYQNSGEQDIRVACNRLCLLYGFYLFYKHLHTAFILGLDAFCTQEKGPGNRNLFPGPLCFLRAGDKYETSEISRAKKPALHAKLHALDDMILILLIQLNKVTAPAPNPHNEIAVIFRMPLGVQHGFFVYSVKLQLMTAHIHKRFYQHGHLSDAVWRAEHRVVQLQSKGAAVDGF